MLDCFCHKPLHSRWTQEVLQFVACLLQPESVFTAFCGQVLECDDKSGTCCELVRDFLQKRGGSEEVEQMVRDKLRMIRGTEHLIAGLCHQSLEIRRLVLSEMKQFGVPSDPFVIVARLQKVAEDYEAEWYTRAAAFFWLVQIAQMDS